MNKLGDMDLFVRVVKNEGFALAGKEVGLSPASMSARIKALEKRYGTLLLNRTTRHVSPTEAGMKFYKASLSILADVDEAESVLRHGRQSFAGRLRISAPSDLGQQHIEPLLAKFTEAHPEVKVYLHLSDGLVNLNEDGFDLALRYGKLEDSSMIARRLCSNQRVLCASPEYLERMGCPKIPEDLLKHSCLAMVRTAERLCTWHFQYPDGRRSISIDPTHSSNDGAIIRKWGLAGSGIALKSRLDIFEDLRENRLVSILEEFMPDFSKTGKGHADLHLLYPSRKYMPQRLIAFRELLYGYFPRT